MTLNLVSLAIVSLFLGWGAYGVVLLRAGQTRIIGSTLIAQAALGLGLLWLLATLPFGIGEPLIRVPVRQMLAEAAGVLATVGGGTFLSYLVARRVGPRRHRRSSPLALAALLLAIPLLGGPAIYALTQLSLPERERERDPHLRQITLSEGFAHSVYVEGAIDNPTVMVFGPEGELYIGDIAGTLWVARDLDGDHRAERVSPWAEGFQLLLGLAWKDDELFVASAGKIEALRDRNGDGRADERRTLVEGLPSMVLKPHSNNQIVFGPDGRLYFGVGSTTVAEHDPSPLAASILAVNPDGSDLDVFAHGFGNPYGVAFNAEGDLFGGDNSPGVDTDQPDELNHIVAGEHYGFPYVYGNPEDRLGTTGAVASFPAHSAPTGLAFYSGDAYPESYYNNAFVTLWARGEIARVELARTAGGLYLSRVSTFARGFLYPIHALTGPDGNLYVADFGTSAIYRITYQSPAGPLR